METKYGLRIGILNIGTLREKEEEVTLLMEERRLNIFGISETREKISGRRVIHNDYICLSSGDVGGKHGVAFIIAPAISHLVEKFVPIDNRMAGMILKIGTSRILFMTVYAPQQGRNDEEKDRFFLQLQEEIDKLRQNEEVIVMGDLNGHVGQRTEGYEQVIGHHGIGQRNTEGDRILNFCNSNGMKIMNTYFQHRESHKYTWYGWNGTKQQYDRQTQIDLFLVTNHCNVCNVKAIPSVSLDSDHRLVVMQTSHTIKKLKPAEKKKRVNLHNLANGENMRKEFEEQITQKNRETTTEEDEDVEKHWRSLKTDINNSIENTVGFKWTSVSRKKQTAWWNEELKSQVKYKQRCFRLWMKSRTPESREAYTTARREAHKFKRQAKTDAWNTLCKEMERDVIGTKKLIYQLAKSYRKGQQQHPFTIKMKDSDEIITEPEEVKTCWTDYLSNLLNVDTPGNDGIGESRFEDNMNIEEITEDEVKRAVDRSRNGKAPGCDIIPNEIYKTGNKAMICRLTKLFNTAYSTGRIPEEWGKAEIYPIYKQKGDYLKCENYRGISLMCHVAKLYESVLEARLRRATEDKLGPWQHGFRKGVGTCDMIFALRQLIEKHWEFSKPLYIAFLDLEKAFDRIPRGNLWQALNTYEIPMDLQRAIESTYKVCMSKVNTQMGGGKWFDTKSGVRQGSILSPLLFILYMDLVIKEVHGINDNDKQFILAYADDIAQTAATKEELEKCMTTWNTAFTKYQLKLNLMKTEVVVINRTPSQVRITLHDIEIKQVEHFKYLGCNVNTNGTIEEENGQVGYAPAAFLMVILDTTAEEEESSATKKGQENSTDENQIGGWVGQEGERRKSYSAAVIDGIKRNSRIYVGDSIVRKTDTRLSKEEDVVVCLPGARIEHVTERVEKIMGRGKGGTILVHIGTNNADKEGTTAIVDKYRKLLKKTKEARVEQIILSGILPVFGNRLDGYRNAKRMAINGMVKRLCMEEDVGYVDLWDSLVGKEEMYARDGLHLSGKGAAVFAEGLSGAVASGLGKVRYLN